MKRFNPFNAADDVWRQAPRRDAALEVRPGVEKMINIQERIYF